LYAYDAEGRVCAVQQTVSGYTTTTGYIYDADGNRVAKGSINASVFLTSSVCNPSSNGFQLTESYVVGQSGEELTTRDGSNNWQRTNVYGASGLFATYDSLGLHFQLTDPLGTRRMQTSSVGQPELDCQSLPYGDGLYCFEDANAPATADDATPLHFTGKERDSESGNDYFGARYYASPMGRFLSPDYNDTGDGPDPVPYADFGNPQSLNLYSYVLNNPLKRTDPTGHTHQECAPDTTSTDPTTGTVTVTAGACHDVPDWWNVWTNFMNWRQNMANNWNQRIAAHQPPPQQNNPLQALQDINNVMMGLVPAGGVHFPDNVIRSLETLDASGSTGPGYEGGRSFQNDGRGGGEVLPKTDSNGNPISYKEWDVNAKQPGVNRGSERLVTGSDGSAYYTNNHYQTFQTIRTGR